MYQDIAIKLYDRLCECNKECQMTDGARGIARTIVHATGDRCLRTSLAIHPSPMNQPGRCLSGAGPS